MDSPRREPDLRRKRHLTAGAVSGSKLGCLRRQVAPPLHDPYGSICHKGENSPAFATEGMRMSGLRLPACRLPHYFKDLPKRISNVDRHLGEDGLRELNNGPVESEPKGRA